MVRCIFLQMQCSQAAPDSGGSTDNGDNTMTVNVVGHQPTCTLMDDGQGQTTATLPYQQQQGFNPPAQNKPNPCSGAKTRSTLHGALDLGLGVSKIGLGILAAPETGGLSLYGVYSGLSNVVSGGAELYGGYSGNLAGSERVANYAAAAGSVSGLTTLAITGNPQYGANASSIEGLAFVGATGGLVSTGAMETPGMASNTVTALDNGVGAAGLIGIGGCHD